MTAFVATAHDEHADAIVKVIVEATELDPESLQAACRVVEASGAGFAKTSTGLRGGARVQDVSAMRTALPASVQIKASGGIRDAQSAAALLEAGASRLGTSSAIAILQQLERDAVA